MLNKKKTKLLYGNSQLCKKYTQKERLEKILNNVIMEVDYGW